MSFRVTGNLKPPHVVVEMGSSSAQPAMESAGPIEQLAKRVRGELVVQEPVFGMEGFSTFTAEKLLRLDLVGTVEAMLRVLGEREQELIRTKLTWLTAKDGGYKVDDGLVTGVVREAARLIIATQDAKVFGPLASAATDEERKVLVDGTLFLTQDLPSDRRDTYAVLNGLKKIAREEREGAIEAFVPYLPKLDGYQRAALLETSSFVSIQEWKMFLPTFIALFRGVEGVSSDILYSLRQLPKESFLLLLNMALPSIDERSVAEKVGVLEALSLFSIEELVASFPLLIAFFTGVRRVDESRSLCDELRKTASKFQYLQEMNTRRSWLQNALLAYPSLDPTKQERVLQAMKLVPANEVEAFFPIVVSIVDEMAEGVACTDLIRDILLETRNISELKDKIAYLPRIAPLLREIADGYNRRHIRIIVDECCPPDIETRFNLIALIKGAKDPELRHLNCGLHTLTKSVRATAFPIIFDLVNASNDSDLHAAIFEAAKHFPPSEISLWLPPLVSLFLKYPRYQDYGRLPSIIEKLPTLSDIQLLDFIFPSLVGSKREICFIWAIQKLSKEKRDLFFASPKGMLAAGNKEDLTQWIETIPEDPEKVDEWVQSFPFIYTKSLL